MKEFVEAVLLEGRVTCVKGVNKLLIIVSPDNFHSVRSHHKGSRKPNVPQSNYINHIIKYYFNYLVDYFTP